MPQHVVLILRDGQPPRIVGPFLSELTGEAIADLEGLREGEYLIQPLEAPPETRGRHELQPSPYPRGALCQACGNPFLPTHSVAAPGPTARHPFKLSVRGPHADHVIVDDYVSPVGAAVDRMLEERRQQLGDRGVRALYEQTPPPPTVQEVPDHIAYSMNALLAGGRPITSWVEAHADQLRRFVPTTLPEPPKEIDQ